MSFIVTRNGMFVDPAVSGFFVTREGLYVGEAAAAAASTGGGLSFVVLKMLLNRHRLREEVPSSGT